MFSDWTGIQVNVNNRWHFLRMLSFHFSRHSFPLAVTVLMHVCACAKPFCCLQLFATLWTAACWAPLSMGFSTQEYWSGLAFPSPGDLPNLEIKPVSLMSAASAGMFLTTSVTWEAQSCAWKADTVTCHLFDLKPQAKGTTKDVDTVKPKHQMWGSSLDEDSGCGPPP